MFIPCFRVERGREWKTRERERGGKRRNREREREKREGRVVSGSGETYYKGPGGGNRSSSDEQSLAEKF